jgi:hypothetical protein
VLALTLKSALALTISKSAKHLLLPLKIKKGNEMTRDEAYSRCPADSYVEYYGNQWLIIPFAPVEQPSFFVCQPGEQLVFA